MASAPTLERVVEARRAVEDAGDSATEEQLGELERAREAHARSRAAAARVAVQAVSEASAAEIGARVRFSWLDAFVADEAGGLADGAPEREFVIEAVVNRNRHSIVFRASCARVGDDRRCVKLGDVHHKALEALRGVPGVVAAEKVVRLRADFDGFARGAAAVVMPELWNVDQAMGAGLLGDKDTPVRWGRQLGAALRGAHERGWLHRDIKTDNVLVAPGSHDAVLTDWDFAAAEDSEEGREREFVGTKKFAAGDFVASGFGFVVAHNRRHDREALVYTLAWLSGERWSLDDVLSGARIGLDDAVAKYPACAAALEASGGGGGGDGR